MSDWVFKTAKDVELFEKTPLNERMIFFNTFELIQNGASLNPEAPAISFIKSGEDYQNSVVVSYTDFMASVTRAANLFHDLGIGSRDVITYLLPNLPQTHYVLWGGQAAGIVNPVNPMLDANTIIDICRTASTKVLVALGEMPGSDIWEKAETVRRELPELKAVVRVAGPSDDNEGIVGFEETLSKCGGSKLDSGRIIDPHDTASIYHTGGTTGRPKLVPRSHFNEAYMAFCLSETLEFQTGETVLCGLPLFHANGTTVTGLFPFSIGGNVVILSPAGYREQTIMRNFFRIAAHFQAVTFSAVPTILGVLAGISPEDVDISSLRYVICGAAPLSVDLFQRFERHAGVKILEGYGLTEGTCASSANPFLGERKIGSIGLRLPYQEMKSFILDEDGNYIREAEIDEIGAIHIRGPNVFRGYLENIHNRGIWTNENWFNTGDLGRQDEDGYFWLTGRRKELIIRGGHNIDPASIENSLYSLPGIAVAAAVGRPDAYAGEVPVAFVQLQDGFDYTSDQLRKLLQKKIGERAAAPKEIYIVDQIPLTPVGKIFKPKLQWDVIKRVFLAELGDLDGTAESLRVEVGEHRIHGTLAVIKVKPVTGKSKESIAEHVSKILMDYTIRYEVEICLDKM